MSSHNASIQLDNDKFSYNISISKLKTNVEINLNSTSEVAREETINVLVNYINMFEKLIQS